MTEPGRTAWWVTTARRTARGILGASLLAAFALGGCGDSTSGDHGCHAFCDAFCKQLDKCQIAGAGSCASQCSASFGAVNCEGARPPDQLTCSELGNIFQCANYCATLCTRAPQCGSFDEVYCTEGCASQPPIVCNPASVAARTCDQLKPELRISEDRGRALHSIGDQAVFGTSETFGLCTTSADCFGPVPQICDLATNVCRLCMTDADCKLQFGAHACAPDGSCNIVDCVEDADCTSGRRCDVPTHKCVT